MAGWTWISVTPGCRSRIAAYDALAAAGPPVVVEVVGEDDALLGGQAAEREAGLLGA